MASTVQVSVPAVATTTTLDPIDAVTAGDSKTLTATVGPAGVTAAVQFKVNGVAVGGPVTVVNGVVTVQRTFATAGQATVTADFVGTGDYADSSAHAQTVTASDGGGGTGSLGSMGSLGSVGRLFR